MGSCLLHVHHHPHRIVLQRSKRFAQFRLPRTFLFSVLHSWYGNLLKFGQCGWVGCLISSCDAHWANCSSTDLFPVAPHGDCFNFFCQRATSVYQKIVLYYASRARNQAFTAHDSQQFTVRSACPPSSSLPCVRSSSRAVCSERCPSTECLASFLFFLGRLLRAPSVVFDGHAETDVLTYLRRQLPAAAV